MALISHSTCANANADAECNSKHSTDAPGIVCSFCYLVQYCSRDCQLKDSSRHGLECKSPLSKPGWKPSWEFDRRTPAFVGDGEIQEAHGVQKFLWGNIPALDKSIVDPVEFTSLTVSASGDLRNVVQTVAGLPRDFSKRCEIFVNDKDEDIVARNVIILLAARCFDPSTVPEALLHIWYSALIPTSVLGGLQEKVLPLVQDVCNKIEGKGNDLLLSKTWNFSTCTIRVMLKKRQWNHVLQYLHVPVGLDTVQALKVRKATTLAPHRIDYLHRSYCSQPSGWRAARQKFREDGLLLPFGASRTEFRTPNPTFFQTEDTWPMTDSSDPLDTWPMKDIIEQAKSTKNDLYGGLHRHVANILGEFCAKLVTLETKFHVTQVDAMDLAKTLDLSGKPESSFDRIEVSNIIDYCHLGPQRTLDTFSKLLRPPEVNPHATLITLSLNAVQEANMGEPAMENIRDRLLQVARYVPRPNRSQLGGYKYSKPNINGMSALTLFMDFDGLFEKYKKATNLLDLGKKSGLKLKPTNTIVEAWPYRLRPNASQEDFDVLFASGQTGCERYMEWARDESLKK